MEKERKGRDRIRLLMLLLLVTVFVLVFIGKNGLSLGLTLAATLGYVLSLIILLMAAIPAVVWKRPDLRVLRLMEMERDHRREIRQAYVTSERRRRFIGKVLCVGLLIEGLVLGWICITPR